MAAWNPRPDWLLEAVRSALDQRGVDLELLVVDDGSDTPLEDVLGGIEDPRLRIVRLDHEGASAARNAGVAAARGEFIRFVDADDVLEPDSTARLAALLGERRDEIAYGATLVCDEELRPEREIRSSLEGDALRACLLDGFEVRVPSMLFPREVVLAAGPWPQGLRVGEDWDFVLRTLERAHVRGDQQVAMLYRRHRASLTADVEAGEHGCRVVIDRYFERHPEERGSPLEREARARVALIFARAWMEQGERGRGARLLLEAARVRPRAGLAAAARIVPDQLIRGLRRRVRRRVEWLALNMPPARRLRMELAREALERHAGDGELRVLDAGCEIGLFAIDLSRRHPGWHVDAVDVDPQSLAEARRLAAERSASRVEFTEADLTRALPRDGYDAVVVLEAFGEIPDDAAAARTVTHALRPGGVLLTHVAVRDWTPVLRGSRTHWKAAHRSGYSADEITGLLEGAGLEVRSIEPTLRGTAHLAQELREHLKSKPLRLRALLSPLMGTAVRLERAGLTWGEPRGMFVSARRPG
jgi:glycosyltransferase involved in cell wall biosynthesis/protein-L-isoaspartate O-methyltransferase